MVTVVYACDDEYARQTLISMVSVIKHNSAVKFYLAADGLSQENRELMVLKLAEYGQLVQFIDIKNILPELRLDEGDRHPRTIYVKLFLGNVVEEERILYLDSDIVVQDTLEPLFQREMENELIAGVLMPYSRKLKERIHAPAEKPYICDGAVMFNMNLWKQRNKSKECQEYIERFEGRPPMLSEGTLNHVCEGAIGILEPKYNLMPSMLMYSLPQIKQLFKADYYYRDENLLREAKEKPTAIHFMNELYNRPWFEPCDHPYRECYKCIERELFGKNEVTQRPLARHTKLTVCLKQYLPFVVFAKLYHIKNRED